MTEELKKQGGVDDATTADWSRKRLPRRPSWMTPPRLQPSARLAAKRSTRKTNVPRTSAPAPRQSVCATWTTKTRTNASGYLGDGAPPVE